MKYKCGICLGFLLMMLLGNTVFAGSLTSVTGPSQIQPMVDTRGRYMLKSDGFYCLDENGAFPKGPEVHYFDHYEIDGTIFDGFYYHGADGQFLAGEPQLIVIKDLVANHTIVEENQSSGEIETSVVDTKFSGVFMIGNLGKMSGAPQVHYLDHVQINGGNYNGYYYFNENGRLLKENAIYDLHMECNGKTFDGLYYFGGPSGSLLEQEGTTPDGFPVDKDGKIGDLKDMGIDTLGLQLDKLLKGYTGSWSIYIKDLQSGDLISIRNTSLGTASVIKTFVMAATFEHMEDVLDHEAKLMKKNVTDPAVQKKVDDLLWNMITLSDNESYNELVRLQSDKHDFREGAKLVNAYLEKEGYKETACQNSLLPSATPSTGLGGKNITSVEDCGKILEEIYNGTCVSKEASDKMLNLLMNQTKRNKIPAGLPANVTCGNKTGENNHNQNDIAIVFGEHTDYIICIMSENYGHEGTAYANIKSLSATTYNYVDKIAQVRQEDVDSIAANSDSTSGNTGNTVVDSKAKDGSSTADSSTNKNSRTNAKGYAEVRKPVEFIIQIKK